MDKKKRTFWIIIAALLVVGSIGIGISLGDVGIQGTATGGDGSKGAYGKATNTGDVRNYGGFFVADGSRGRGVYGKASNIGDYINCGGFFYASGVQGRGVFGQSNGSSGYGVKGWASDDGDVENYGGHFCAAGNRGIGVYGWAENEGSGENYGGYFVAEGGNGTGVYGRGSEAGYFDGRLTVDGSSSPALKLITTHNDAIQFDGSGSVPFTFVDLFGRGWRFYDTGTGNGELVRITNTGNVGIGTTKPLSKLDVYQGDLHVGTKFGDEDTSSRFIRVETMTPGEPSLVLSRGDNWATKLLVTETSFRIRDFGGHEDRKDLVTVLNTGKVGIGTTSPGEKLTVRGKVLIESESTGNPVVELGEGLDYAEGFDVSDKTGIVAGTVLIIDPDHPGKLTISDTPYDTKVAGIVAGANGTGSGVRLGADQFDYDVALAGRVYCNVDATEAGVELGDLLTSSATPGYAMKATDYERAQGAILGKAMERLEEGEKGQILVLVTLQ